MISTDVRPRILQYGGQPSDAAVSPVLNQPSASKASAVASGRFQYSLNRLSPFTNSSPGPVPQHTQLDHHLHSLTSNLPCVGSRGSLLESLRLFLMESDSTQSDQGTLELEKTGRSYSLLMKGHFTEGGSLNNSAALTAQSGSSPLTSPRHLPRAGGGGGGAGGRERVW